MGTTYKGLYLPGVSELGWDDELNADLSKVADNAGTFFLPAQMGWDHNGASASIVGTFPVSRAGFQLPNGLTAGAAWIFQLPHMATTSTFTARPFWSANAGDATAHSIRWQMEVKQFDTTGTSTGGAAGAGTQIPWTGNSLAHGGAITYLENGALCTVTVAPHVPLRFAISRIGGDALDTFTADATLYGVRIDVTGA